MVIGLEAFVKHFADQAGKYVIIGGAACDHWMEKERQSFRQTKDLDVVLLIEEMDQTLRSLIWGFVRAGCYEVSDPDSKGRNFFRFAKPQTVGYPLMIELFCRRPDHVVLSAGQRAAPIAVDGDAASLSAILLDDQYYSLVREHVVRDGELSILDIDGLIVLKAKAWLNMVADRAAGRAVHQSDLNKHRNDVFRMGAIMRGAAAERVPDSIRGDILAFLDSFQADSPEWPSIVQALRQSISSANLATAHSIKAAILRRFELHKLL